MYAGKAGQSLVLRTMPAVTPSRRVGIPGAIVEEWSHCVSNITVSSRERQANRLYDRSLNGCWQSSGRQGLVSCLLLSLATPSSSG